MVSTFPKAYGCTIFVIDINICCFYFYIFISHFDPDFTRTIITHLIVINIVPLTEFFGNCLLDDLQLPVELMRSTSNHMSSSSDFWDKSPSYFLKFLKLQLQLQNFQKCSQAIYSKSPSQSNDY